MYTLVLGHDNSADQARIMQDQMSAGSAMAMQQQDSSKAFKSEWEALEIVDHQWALEGADTALLSSQTVD